MKKTILMKFWIFPACLEGHIRDFYDADQKSKQTADYLHYLKTSIELEFELEKKYMKITTLEVPY